VKAMKRILTFAVIVTVSCAIGGAAQVPDTIPINVALTVPAGAPLNVELEKTLPIKKAGERIEGRVTQPVYVFDKVVIPAGSEVLGRITRVEGVPRKRRALAIANGNFSPLRSADLEFDTLVLPGGEQVRMQTAVSQGPFRLLHLVAGGQKQGSKSQIKGRLDEARQQVKAQEKQTIEMVKAPGKMKRIERALSAQLPYHKQNLPRGTHLVAVLKAPLSLGTEECPAAELKGIGKPIPPDSLVRARLVTGLSSATSPEGSKVEAVISQPLFSPKHELILPEGTRLEGEVTRVQPARRLARSGRLRFDFRRMELPKDFVRPEVATERVDAGIEGVDVLSSSHIKLDKEGGAKAVASKTRFIMPAIDVLLATSSFDTDSRLRSAQENATGDAGAATGGAVRGAAGFGLVGSLVGLIARSQPVSAAFAFYGAGWSVYSHLIARGSDVTFPVNTTLEIQLGTHNESKPAQSKTSAPKKLTIS
jgi:hypothetical protein